MSDNLKHTPAPWEVDKGYGLIIVHHNNNDICELHYRLGNKNTTSDAHLIAAAPELLEALVHIRNMHKPDSPIYKHAQKAIKKAIGE